jgi:hypothetical protein
MRPRNPGSVPARLRGWLTEPVPRGRVAGLRTLVYLFVAGDAIWFTPWVRAHADVPGPLYRPLLVGRLLHLPTPTPVLVRVVFCALLAVTGLALTGRAPRLFGWAVLVAYSEWMIIAMSYGKVDHDRFALLVALAVLPTAGPARHGEATRTERGGWALRVVQLAVVATYFLSAWAKLRFGGIGWLTGATLTRAVIRRGTWLTDSLVAVPGALTAGQFAIMTFELTSPLVFVVRARLRYLMVAAFYLFHALVFATITITFLPHQVAMASFLPLERVRPLRRLGARPELRWLRTGPVPGALLTRIEAPAGRRRRLPGRAGAGRRATGQAVPVAGDPPVHRPGERNDGNGSE